MRPPTGRARRRDLALLWHQVRYEQLSFWRNPQSAFFTFVFPVVIITLFGALFHGVGRSSYFYGLSALQYYVPTIAAVSVLGACYSGILRLEGVSAIPWVSRFLIGGDEAAGEAALSIAGTHSPRAFDTLQKALDAASDPWFRSVLLSAIALTRQDAALEFLLDLVKAESLDAEFAIEAIVRSMPSEQVVHRLEALVKGNPRLVSALATQRLSRG